MPENRLLHLFRSAGGQLSADIASDGYTIAQGLGTLGILIPPSITFIVYGVLTEQSISKLFIAGMHLLQDSWVAYTITSLLEESLRGLLANQP